VLSSVQRDVLVEQVGLAVARVLPSSRPWVPADRVIWREQDAPFPPEPFVTVGVLGAEEEGAEAEEIKGAGTQRVLRLEGDPPDGLYTVTIDGTDYEATAASSTSDDILRALADAMLEGGERLAATIDGDRLRLFALEPGETFAIEVASPASALELEVLDPAIYSVLLEVVRTIWRVSVEIHIGTRLDDSAPAHIQGPADLMRRIVSWLGKGDTGTALQAAGLAIFRVGPTREPAARIRGAQWGRRGVVDLQIRIAVLETASVDWIETFAGAGTLTADGLAEPIAIPFEAPPPEP
jgi:hypothetical protein